MTVPPAIPPAHNSGTEITLFSNDEFRLEITPHDSDGFHVQAPGVARQLGFREAHDLLRNIPDAEKGSELSRTPNGGQPTTVSYLTEAGFYRALGQRQASRISDTAARAFVERFQSWVFGEVLPKLRRGELVSSAPTAPVALPTTRELALLVLAAEDRADAQAARAAVAEQRNAELEPKAAAADALLDVEGTVSMGAVANMFKIGRTKFFTLLRKEKILQGDRRPYQEYADWFRVVTGTYESSDGGKHVHYTSHMYPAGALRLHALLTKRGHELRKPVIDGQLRLLDGGAA